MLALRAVGKGRTAAEKVLMNLGVPVSNASWGNHYTNLFNLANENTDENMKEIRNKLYDCFLSNKSHTERFNAWSSFDCYWNTRG